MRSELSLKWCSGLPGRWWLAVCVLWLAACGGEPLEQDGMSSPSEAPLQVSTRPLGLKSSNKVLILSETVRGGGESVEARKARLLGYEVEFADSTRWKRLSSADFAAYRALILGDNSCSQDLGLIQAAVDSAYVWGPVVDGNVIVLGTDPVYHGQGG